MIFAFSFKKVMKLAFLLLCLRKIQSFDKTFTQGYSET